MKNLVRQQLLDEVAQSDPNCIVFVSKEFAHCFRPPPPDGRTYYIRDERRPWLIHVSGPHIQCTLDEKNPKDQVHQYVNGKRVPPKYGLKTKPQQVDKTKSFLNADQDAPAIRLIGIKRVEQITGFGKSYIYENCGSSFPQRISFGISQRSASRWIESEVVAWATHMAAGRSTTNQLTQ